MNQLLFIETFVFGSATIAAVYHLVLFLQQRDKFLIWYSIYLFSLAAYIGFKLATDNYNPFEPSMNTQRYILEEILQISMVCIYTTFAAITLEVTTRDRYVMILWMLFLVVGALSISGHIIAAAQDGEVYTTRFNYGLSRFSIIIIATLALILVWQLRKTPFQRTIIIGSLVYDCSGFLSALSFVTDSSIFGLTGVEPYLVGCLADIVIFSSAFGYRIKKVAEEKNTLLRNALENQLALEKMRSGIASNLHDDVGSTLSSISIYSEAVKQSIQSGEKEKAIGLLNQLGQDARSTISSMSDIVWAINPRNDTFDKLIARMRSFASEICRAKSIQFNLQIEEDLLNLHWNMSIRNSIYLLYKEAINNSAKYAEATVISVKFRLIEGEAILEVSDNGIGFNSALWSEKATKNEATDAALGGNGISNMYSRAGEMKAQLILNSKAGAGTQIILIIPQIELQQSTDSKNK
jgi:signal transduction histidine kinase